ncbi:hypothetical protein [Pseudofrankia asymbiotica]|uniref:hypothetical protein n=1 Tax=Pseudofrankia asymbiotica TaxID=1834516 RepID=UPI00130461E0|nr:hypothetical protein [Pseudofrankia asymbiotica]
MGVAEELVQAQRLCDALGEIFCLTFIRGVDTAEALANAENGWFPAVPMASPLG